MIDGVVECPGIRSDAILFLEITMRRVRILLLETPSDGRHLDTLERVLRSSSWSFDIERRRGSEPGLADSFFGPDGESTRPDVVFLEIGNDRSWWQGTGSAGRGIPVFAVSEATDPEELFGLLALGFTEVLPPPLTPITVLPRLWLRLGRYHFVPEISLPARVASVPFRDAKKRVVAGFERTYLTEVLTTHRGNITQAARAAKKDRRAFWELMRKHRIDVSQFQSPAVG